MALGRAGDAKERQMPEGRNQSDHDRRPEHADDRLHPLEQKSPPSKFLAGRPTDQQDQEKGRRDRQPAGRIRQVGDAAPFQNVDVKDHDPDRGRCEEGGCVPLDADPPAEGLREERP